MKVKREEGKSFNRITLYSINTRCTVCVFPFISIMHIKLILSIYLVASEYYSEVTSGLGNLRTYKYI